MSAANLINNVSVVIPSRDGTSTLQRALDSLLGNAEFIREVIIVLSNSSSQYREFCARLVPVYADHFAVAILDSGSASNGSIARNCGIDAAQASYVALLDDDDEWAPDRLAAYASYLDRARYLDHEHVDENFVLFSTVISCREDRSAWLLFPDRPYRNEPIASFILSPGGGAQTSSLLLPTRLARAARFDPELPRHQDYDFCLRLAEYGVAFHHLEIPLGYWYRRGDNAGKGGTLEFCEQWLQQNAGRLPRRAFVGYLETELFAATRQRGTWWRYLQLLARQLSAFELMQTVLRLSTRTAVAAVRRLSPAAVEAIDPLTLRLQRTRRVAAVPTADSLHLSTGSAARVE